MARSSERNLLHIAAMALTMLATSLGCHRPTEDAPPAERSVTAASGKDTPAVVPEGASLPADTEAAGGPDPSEADLNAVLAALTQAVRRYGVEQRQVPASLEELVAKGYLSQVPEAPRGKRFRINKQLQVYLAND